jgi:hypothetical protein
MTRTASVYKALRTVAQAARRSEEMAEKWKKEYGPDDDMRRYDMVRAEALYQAIQIILDEIPSLQVTELFPDYNPESV